MITDSFILLVLGKLIQTKLYFFYDQENILIKSFNSKNETKLFPDNLFG